LREDSNEEDRGELMMIHSSSTQERYDGLSTHAARAMMHFEFFLAARKVRNNKERPEFPSQFNLLSTLEVISVCRYFVLFNRSYSQSLLYFQSA
jgi:hypothetical protein